MSDEEEEIECEHEFEPPHYMCKKCGADCEGQAIDEAFDKFEDQ